MRKTTTHEAKTHLSKLLAAVEAGEEVVICRGATPIARLVPVNKRLGPRRPRIGTITSGQVRASEDAFAAWTDEELATWGL